MTDHKVDLLKTALACRCPKCGKGPLYKPGLTLNLREICPVCGLDLAGNDSADGPAVVMIFVLGLALVPLALVLDANFTIPLWVHAVLWSVVALGLTVGTLRPLKSYIIALQYKHLLWDSAKKQQRDEEDHNDDTSTF